MTPQDYHLVFRKFTLGIIQAGNILSQNTIPESRNNNLTSSLT